MSKAFRELAKHLYHDLKEGSRSLERSAQQSSGGFVDGLSMMSQFKLSDDLSLNGSELSLAHSALLGNNNNLETINELPARQSVLIGRSPAPEGSGRGVCAKGATLDWSFEQEQAKDPRKNSRTMKGRSMKPLSRARDGVRDRKELKQNTDRGSQGKLRVDMGRQTPPSLSSPSRERQKHTSGSQKSSSLRKSILKPRMTGDGNLQGSALNNPSTGARECNKGQLSEASRQGLPQRAVGPTEKAGTALGQVAAPTQTINDPTGGP